MDNKLKTDLWIIGTPGVLGGLVTWILSLGPNGFRLVGPGVDLPLFLFFGGVASLTFVVLLSNTERGDVTRVVALSFLT